MLTNEMRARYGHAATKAGNPDQNDHETEVIDTLANMMHWCARRRIDFDDCVRRAENHYTAEIQEEKE